MEAPPVGIRTNAVIDAKASNFEGLRDMQGGHCGVWCDRARKSQNWAEVRGWGNLNSKCCDRGLLGGIY